MDRETQIAEMACDINDCITEFITDTGDVYIDDEVTAQKMFDKGYRRQSEVVKEIFEEIEKLSHRFMNDKYYIFADMMWDIAELKEKYTEESENDRS